MNDPGCPGDGERVEPGGGVMSDSEGVESVSSVTVRVSVRCEDVEMERTPSESLLMTGGMFAGRV